MAAFRALPRVTEVIASGDAETSVRAAGLQVDLRVVPSRAAARTAVLHRMTGAQRQDPGDRGPPGPEAVRVRPLRRGFRGVPGRRGRGRDLHPARPPSGSRPAARGQRGDRGRVRGELPPLVTEPDVRGDLHTHTDLTDGVAPLEVMLAAAAARGYAYYAVTDHAPNLVFQRMTDEKMLAQRDQVRRLRWPVLPGCGCCTAPSSTSIPTGTWTGGRSSSAASTCAWPRCIHIHPAEG